MRRRINILWLDDDEQTNCVELRELFEEIVKDKGYSAKIKTVSTIKEATDAISDKKERIDFFVSDLNLNNGANNQDGIDFLVNARRRNMKKQFFILYSHITMSALRDSILNKIENNKRILDNFNNFSFFSAGDLPAIGLIKSELSDILDIALIRWDELAALRGEYAAINTLADSILETILTLLRVNTNKLNYCNKIDKLKKIIKKGNLISSLSMTDIDFVFDKWHSCRETRNSLEHNPEQWDSSKMDFYIFNKYDSSNIYEANAANNRKKIINEVNQIKRLLADLISKNVILSNLTSETDYCSFMNDD